MPDTESLSTNKKRCYSTFTIHDKNLASDDGGKSVFVEHYEPFSIYQREWYNLSQAT